MTTTTEQRQEGAAPSAAPRAPLGPVLVGVLLVVTGVFLLREAITALDEDGVDLNGPRLAPIVVSVGWVLLAVLYLVNASLTLRRGRTGSVEESSDEPGDEPDSAAASPQWITPVALVAVLVAYILILEPVGFVLATCVFFVLAARILGSRRIVRDLAVAVPLGLVIYLGFTRVLEISLPGGVLPL